VIVGFIGARNKFTLLDHIADRHVRAFIEELRRREDTYAVALGDEKKSILGKTHTVWNDEVKRWGEALHLVGRTVLVAVGNSPYGIFPGADEGHHPLRSNRHVPGVRNDGIEIDFEAFRQFYLLEVVAQLLGVITGLGHDVERRHLGAGRLHLA
jgi:hypothetical protein